MTVPVPQWITVALDSTKHEGLEGTQLVMKMIRELRGLDFSNDEIIKTIGHSELIPQSAESFRKLLDGMDAKERSAERGAPTSDVDYARLNNKYAVVMLGSDTVIFSLGPDGSPIYQTFESFKKFQSKWTKQYKTVDAKGAEIVKSCGQGEWWLDQRAGHRRQYEAVRYMPWSDDEVVDGCLNLWTGFAVQPKAGDEHESFLDHLRENICDGNADHYRYLIGWLASRVHIRNKPAGVAIVLKSESEGTGKGFAVKTIGRLFGRHYKHITNADHLIGKFNAHLQDCQVLFADEAFFAGDKRHAGILKTLITEETITIEHKGVNVQAGSPNFMGLIIASNNKFVVPAGHSARRYFVLEVALHRMQDTDYFESVQRDLDGGGYESLLHFLLNYDLTGFNIRAVPQTAALAEQKSFSLSPDDQWWHAVLSDGRLPGAWSATQPSSAYSRLMFDDARARSPKLRDVSDHSLALFVQTKGAVHHRTNKANGWRFPPLPECRKAWTDRYQGASFPEPGAHWTVASSEDQGRPDQREEVDYERLPY